MSCWWSKCANCPYYEQTTSYGTEEVRCGNTDCILYDDDEQEGEA